MLQTAAAEINDLDGTLGGVFEQDILWLQVAMNHTVSGQQGQRTKQLDGESLDQGNVEPLEVVDLDKLVQIHAQTFARDAEMASKVKAIRHLDIVVSVFRVPLDQVAENLDLGLCLGIESLLVAYQLHSHSGGGLVVIALDYLTE